MKTIQSMEFRYKGKYYTYTRKMFKN
jgi:hypothetical protein